MERLFCTRVVTDLLKNKNKTWGIKGKARTQKALTIRRTVKRKARKNVLCRLDATHKLVVHFFNDLLTGKLKSMGDRAFKRQNIRISMAFHDNTV